MFKKITSLIIVYFSFLHTYAQNTGIIINEFSLGSSAGTVPEYIELLVVGNPGCVVDLRGWILDDNNSDFSDGIFTGTGIDNGHIRFADVANWSAVPVGSIILIYNSAEKNPSITLVDDPTDANADKVYIVPIDNVNLEMCTTNPSSGGNASYGGCTYVSPASWNVLAITETGDAVQVRSPNGNYFHGLSFGNITGNNGSTTDDLSFGGINGNDKNFFFDNTPNDNFRLVDNFSLGNVSDAETPGLPNNIANQAFITALRTAVVANAGADQSLTCNLTTNLTGNGVIGKWTIVNQPAGSTLTFDDDAKPNANISVSQAGAYTLRWAFEAPCPVSSDEVLITFEQTVTNAGADLVNSCNKGVILGGISPVTNGTWSIVSVPIGSTVTTSNIPELNNPNSTFSVDITGEYVLRWTNNATGCSDDVKILFNSSNPPLAGPNQDICGRSYIMQGNASVSSDVTGYWRLLAVSPPLVQSQTNGNCVTLNGQNGCVSFQDQVTGQENNNLNNARVVVPFPGTYIFRWTFCPDSPNAADADDVTIRFFDVPSIDTIPLASKKVCGFSTTLNAILSTGNTGKWTCIEGPVTKINQTPPPFISFSNVNSPNPNVTVPQSGSYKFVWESAPSALITCFRRDTITVEFYDIPFVDAGPNEDFCGLTYTLQGSALGSTFNNLQQTGRWSVSPHSLGTGTTIFANEFSNNSQVTVTAPGKYTYYWVVSYGDTLCVTRDSVVVNLLDPLADAGLDQPVVCGFNTNLQANNILGTQTGQWTSFPTGAIFGNPNSPNTNVTVPAISLPTSQITYTFRWTVTENVLPSCQKFDEMNVTFYLPPVPDAGADQTGICGLQATMNANLPSGTVGQWTVVSKPVGTNDPIFGNTTSPNTTVTITDGQFGNYVLRWTLSLTDGVSTFCPESDDVIIGFRDFQSISAGPDQPDICGLNTLNANLSATGTNGEWTLVGGPGTANFSNATSATSSVTVSTPGTYVFQWTVERGTTCEISDEVEITFTQALVANAGPNQAPICGLSSVLAGNFVVGQWTLVSGTGIATFSNAASPTSEVTVSASGVYTFRWRIGQGNCANSDDVVIDFTRPIDANAGADQVILTGQNAQLNATGGEAGATYQWSPNTALSNSNVANPIATPLVTTTYTVTITDGHCTDTDQVVVRVLNDVPNVFTPNGDGANEVWALPFLSNFPNCNVKVFNRWGDKVFESNGYTTPWDGKFNGKLVGVSTYYYTIDLGNGDPLYKGSLTVTY